MSKTTYKDKSVKKESTVVKAVETENTNPMGKACEDINKLSGNAYAKARLAYLRRVKLDNPSLLAEALSLLSK